MCQTFSFCSASAFLLLVLLPGCQEKQPKIPAYDSSFSAYISSFTSGVISKKSSVQIHFATSLGDSVAVAQSLQRKDLLQFEPDIKGQLVRKGANSLEFIPDEDLQPGQVYRAELALRHLLDVPDSMGVFTFGFQVLRPGYEWGNIQLLATPEDQMQWYRLKGQLNAADQEDLPALRELFRAELEGEALQVSWQSGDRPQEYIFTVDSLERRETARSLQLRVNRDHPGTDALDDRQIEIASLNDFSFVDHNLERFPSQHIRLNFSDPLQPGQDLSGLITLDNTDDLRMEIENTSVLVYPSQSVYGSRSLRIFPGIRNIRGAKLQDDYHLELQFRNEKPQVELIGDGNIIPLSEQLLLPFKTISLSAVDVRVIKIPEQNVLQFLQNNDYGGSNELYRVGEVVARQTIELESSRSRTDWNHYSLDLAEMIAPEPGAVYRVYFSFEKEHSLYHCEEAADEEEEEQYWYYNDGYYHRGIDQSAYDREDYYFRYPRGYRWNERENPCHVSYYFADRFVTRNIMATNLGLIAKRTEGGELDFTVNHLTDNQSVRGAEIQLYNYQGRLLQKLRTDSKGWARTAIKDRPYFAAAQHNGHKTYLKLNEALALSVSEFDVAGQQVEGGLKGFIYGERGVWRPGDSIFLSFILEDHSNPLPEGHPVHFELKDSRGKVIDRQVRRKAPGRIYPFATHTAGTAPTGNYTATVRVGDRQFTERLKVEMVKPNRLDIDFVLDNDVLDASQSRPEADLAVNWLTGVPAANAKVEISGFLSRAGQPFSQWPTFDFQDPARKFSASEKQVYSGQVGAEGQARVRLQMDAIDEAPGMLQGRFVIKAFEGGGEFSTEVFDAKVSPYTQYVGIEMPKPTRGYYLEAGQGYDMKIKTVDEAGDPVSVNDLEVKVYRVDWHWWYNRQEQNLARYLNNEANFLLSSGQVSSRNGSATFKLNFEEELWGRVLVRVCDPSSGHCSGAFTYVRWPYGRKGTPPQMGGATLLSFSTDQKKYEIGSEIAARIPADEGTRLLVSVENGTGILHKEWVEPQNGVAEFRIEATPEMAPNVYLSASLLQPHAQTENDRPMRLYGIVPVEVYDPATELKPVIESEEVWRPEAKVNVKVKEEKGRAMTYTLAVVDEGLLNLTAFSTPRPWRHFYAKEALGVRSWDMYNAVLGAFGGRLEKVFSIGGDEALAQSENSNLNRFKPVVRFFGPFELKAGSSAGHEFTLPNYIGSARIMVVAADKSRAYGHAEKSVKVRKPLMVLNTLPRMLSPGDAVKLPVTVFAMEDHVRQVDLKLKVTGLVEVEGSTSRSVRFSKNGEQVVNFDLRVPEDRGAARVRVEATSGREKAYDETALKVRIPNPPQSVAVSFVLAAGRDTTLTYEPLGVKGTNAVSLEASTMPPLNLENRLGYLLRYPHGCTEQTISSVFPSLYLSDIMELSEDRKHLRDRNVRIAINKVYERQSSGGGVNYWPGASQYNTYVSTYAGHFLLEAKNRGYDIPAGSLSRWLKFQKSQARSWKPETYNGRLQNHLDQAYRLYVLALAGEPEIGAMNRFREIGDVPALSWFYLSAAYSRAGQRQVAEEILRQARQSGIEEYWGYWYYGRHMRNQAIYLLVMNDLGKKPEALAVARDLANKLNTGHWYSTHSLAMGLSALAAYYGEGSEDQALRWSFGSGSESYNFSGTHRFDTYAPEKPEETRSVRITNTSATEAHFVLNRSGIPIDYDIPAVSDRLSLKVRYLTPSGNALDPTRIPQGQDFVAEVSVTRGGEPDAYRNMALVQMMPTGWEILNTRFLEVENTEEQSAFEYQDVRDDRVYTYFDLYPRYHNQSTATFRIRLNATYAGRFYLPPVEAYDMYNEDIKARVKGQWVEVVSDE